MKKNYLLLLTAVITVFCSLNISAQHTYVNQVLIGSGGNFSNPDEHVTVGTYNPVDESTTFFGEVLTHSIQDIVIDGEFVYVAAQDSIVKYNIENLSRVAVVEAIGINQLLVHENKLFATFQYPATENFVQVFSADDLTHTANITDVLDEAAGMVVVEDNLYVAVPGGWASTTGNITIIDIPELTTVTQIPFGAEGIGVFDLFVFDNKIMSVNRTPYLGTTGYISSMTFEGTDPSSYLINEVIGKMAGVLDGFLYTVMNNGIGAIQLSDFTVPDNSVIDPLTLTIASVELDTVNALFYVATTDYFSMGEGTVYNMLGEATSTFDANISPEAIAIDYRDNTGIQKNELVAMSVYPNPASQVLNIDSDLVSVSSFKVIDITGREVLGNVLNTNSGELSLNISNLKSGVYIICLSDGNQVSSTRFVKN